MWSLCGVDRKVSFSRAFPDAGADRTDLDNISARIRNFQHPGLSLWKLKHVRAKAQVQVCVFLICISLIVQFPLEAIPVRNEGGVVPQIGLPTVSPFKKRKVNIK